MTDEPERKTIDDLLAVMAALRAPDSGCPWDLEQTFATIAPYTLEEAYEVADAIERGDMADLQDELGDLLLQVVYHAQMAREAHAFEFADVVDGIVRKMVRRHPHVFGDAEVKSATELTGLWERIKAEEKQTRGAKDDGKASLGVPVALPGLTRAMKLQRKAAKVGFDWPEVAPVFDKVREELSELESAREEADGDKRKEELGDLLFAVVNLARHMKVDPEAALRAANAKFERRFAHVTARLAAEGRTPEQSDLAEMDRLWDEAKRTEKKHDARG